MEISIKEKLKEVAKHGIVYGLTSSLQNVLTFLLLPILTSYLKPADFGVYSIIILATALAGAIFSFGAPSALGRFYFDEDSDLFRRQVVSMTLLISILGSVILVVGALIFSANISVWLFGTSSYRLHIVLALVAAAFIFLLNVMTLVLRYEKRSVLFMIVMIANVVVNFCITYFLLTKYLLGILAPLYGLMISNCVSFLFLFIVYIRKMTLNLNVGHFSMLMNFGVQASITGLLFYLLDWVDRLILKQLVSMSDVGVYSLGYRIGSILNVLLVVPFGLIWAPIRMQYSTNKNNKDFVAKVFTYFSVIGFSLIILAILFGSEFMDYFFKNINYHEAVTVFPIVMVALLFYGYQNILDYGIYLHKKVYYYITFSAIGLLFNILLNYLFIPIFGYIASAYISMLTYLLTTSLIYIKANNYYRINLEWNRILPFFLIVVILYSGNIFFPIRYQFVLVKKIIILLFLLFLFYKFWLSKDEIARLKAFIRFKSFV